MKINTCLSFVMVLLISSLTAFASNTRTYEDTFKLDSDGSVSIENYKGTIEVETWDKNEIYFYAEVKPDTEWGIGSTPPDEQLKRCKVVYEHSNSSFRIKADYRDEDNGSNTIAFVNYKIKMPATARLTIDDYKSEIEIENLKSDLELETYKGEVKLVNFSGSLDIETYKGEVEADIAKLSGACKFDSYKGEISITIPASSAFNVDFALEKHGDYSSDFDIKVQEYHSDDGVKGTVNGGGPTIYFTTYKGEIKLRKRN